MTNYLWSADDCVKLTEHANPDVRVWALEKTVELYPERAKDLLTRAVDDENALVSNRAMQLIAGMDEPSDFAETLLKKFDSADGWLAGQCAIVLGALKCKEAIPKLTAKLGEEDLDATLWRSLVFALGALKDDETLKVLEELETRANDPQREASIVNALLMHRRPKTFTRLVKGYLKSGAAYNGANWMIGLLTDHLGLSAVNQLLEQAKFPEPKKDDKDQAERKGLAEVLSLVASGVGVSLTETPPPDWMKAAEKAYGKKSYQDYARAVLGEIPSTLRARYPDEKIAFEEDAIEALQDKLTQNELLILSSLLPFARGWKGAMSRKGAADLIKDEIRFITACYVQLAGSRNWDKEIDAANGDEDKLLAILTAPAGIDSDRIVNEVASLGEQIVGRLVSALESWPGNAPAIRAIRALEKIKSESSIPALIECGVHPDQYVRAATTNALVAFGEQILDRIAPTLKEEAVYANATAFSVIARIPTEKSVDIIRGNYDKLVSLGANMVAFVCRQIGSHRLISPLRGMLNADNMSTIGETLALLCAINNAPFPEADALLESRRRRLRGFRRQQRRAESSAEGTGTADQPEEVGRNDPCPCGSGKKYKNCCMQKRTALAK